MVDGKLVIKVRMIKVTSVTIPMQHIVESGDGGNPKIMWSNTVSSITPKAPATTGALFF